MSEDLRREQEEYYRRENNTAKQLARKHYKDTQERRNFALACFGVSVAVVIMAFCGFFTSPEERAKLKKQTEDIRISDEQWKLEEDGRNVEALVGGWLDELWDEDNSYASRRWQYPNKAQKPALPIEWKFLAVNPRHGVKGGDPTPKHFSSRVKVTVR